MKIKLISIFILTILFLCFLGFFIIRQFPKNEEYDSSRTVFIKKENNGFEIIRNGEPFYIKGAAGDSYLPELAESGGNTIRLHDTINLQNKLDEAKKYGLTVIVDIPVPAFYIGKQLSEYEIKGMIQNVSSFIKKYKNHHSLLMWNLGNEIAYPKVNWKDFLIYNRYKRKKNYRNFYNKLIKVIHSEDKNHPVCTSTWDSVLEQYFNMRLFSPELDVISYNSFGGIESSVKRLNNWEKLLGAYPFFISEFGSNGCWFLETKYTSWKSPIEQTSAKKAEIIKNRYNFILTNKNCLGSLIFFWGDRFECTCTWFSLFKDGYKSEILKELSLVWKNSFEEPNLIGLNYMLVDKKGAYDNIIFTSNKEINSELVMDKEISSIKNLIVQWEIYPDVWFDGWNEEKYNTKKMEPPGPIDCSIQSQGIKATFLTPDVEGPYRIFAYVFDKEGYFATTNTPFYILNPNTSK